MNDAFFTSWFRLRRAVLFRALADWSRDHPQYRVLDAQVARFGESLYGLNAFFTRDETPERKRFEVKIHHDLIDDFGKEYLEAVVQDVVPIAASGSVQRVCYALINRRGVAAVVRSRENRVFLITTEVVRAALDREGIKQLEDWLRGETFGYFRTYLPDDYLPPRGRE